uniref:Protein FAM151A n=1 Tax=Cacopsylla melanoneura TaxID=428564 RepID=A0A8D8V2B3_9HEMI
MFCQLLLVGLLCLSFQIQMSNSFAVNDNRTPSDKHDSVETDDYSDHPMDRDSMPLHDYHTDLLEETEGDSNVLESEKFAGDMFNPINTMFPEVKGDLTLITWRHAVNSQAKLKAALNSTAMMLEADVIVGTLTDDPNHVEIPVMGHPPDIESDLSLDQFIDKVIKSEVNKGIKLDFKSIEAFMKAQEVLRRYEGSVPVPIWLNADILAGPVNPATPPVDADTFLNVSVDNYPDDMLSVGWTTQYAPNGKYTFDEHIDPMLKALNRNKVLKAVTFPVRAVFATECIDLLNYLIKTSPAGSSLTVWMSNDADPVSIPKLRTLLSTIGKDKVFLDVPDFVRDRLDKDTEEPNHGPMLRSNVMITCLAALLVSVVWYLR